MIQNKRVLLIDGSAAATELAQKLVRHGYFCELAPSVSVGVAIASRCRCDILLCDAVIAMEHECRMFDQVAKTFPRLPIIVLAAEGVVADAVSAIQRGAFQYLPKSVDLSDLHQHIRHAIALCEEPEVFRPLAYIGADELVHESAAMEQLMDGIARVALSTAALLIVGESGTGKERVARAVHEAGPTRMRPFVVVNMTAIPEQLLESELFGHVRGAYTGATQARAGLLAEADGGSLLLDEIGDMPKILQPKILRLLQFGEVRPVGSDRTRRIDVRIIAATHRDLDALVREGSFRDDLRYRLSTLVLRVPPLRERPEDIRPLVRQFLLDARARTPSSPVTSISEGALALLEKAAWPGNIRELEGAIERLVVFGRHPVVETDELQVLGGPGGDVATAAGPWTRAEGGHFTLRQMNQRYLDWVLEQTHGDKMRAAKLLDIDVSTLYRWQRAKN